MPATASTGIRHIRIDGSHRDTELPREAYGEFYVDGSVFVAVELPGVIADNETVSISDEGMVMTMVALVRLATAHPASHAGAYGDAVVHASLLSVHPAEQALELAPQVTLVHNRQYGHWARLPRTRALRLLPSSATPSTSTGQSRAHVSAW
jgi:hypothetical protein